MLFSFSDALLILFFIWLGILTFLLARLLKTFSKLTKGITDKDLRTVLEDVLKEIGKQKETNTELGKKIEELRITGLDDIQKVGLIRYNPFSDTGGNQSFVLVLLDGEGTGVVITSLHSREATRVFAKPVKEGKESGYEFSKEEIQAILSAQKKEKSVRK